MSDEYPSSSLESVRARMNDKFNADVQELIGKGWKVSSDGPTGVQITSPKKMRTLDMICLVIGALCMLFLWPLGLFLMFIALIDYAVFTKGESKFLPRPTV
jgi:hypothetical protein